MQRGEPVGLEVSLRQRGQAREEGLRGARGVLLGPLCGPATGGGGWGVWERVGASGAGWR